MSFFTTNSPKLPERRTSQPTKNLDDLINPARDELQDKTSTAWNDLVQAVKQCERGSETQEILSKCHKSWIDSEGSIRAVQQSIERMSGNLNAMQTKTSTIAETFARIPGIYESIKLENLTTQPVPPTPLASPPY
jgi:hypothetical protein